MIQRDIEKTVFSQLKSGKVIKLFGARRVGKTVLLEQLSKQYSGSVSLLNGEDFKTTKLLAERTAANYRHILSDTDLLIIDEAQNIPDIGHILKLMVDSVKHISVLVSGSSSFDLMNKTGEPLVGRSYEFKLYPFSLKEISQEETIIQINQNLEEKLIYGLYPELSSIDDYKQKKIYLNEIVNAYLLKDILMLDGIKNASKMRDLLRLISYQIGNLVSYDELGKQLGMSRNTVEKYLDLLSKTFVVYQLPAFSNNPRKEISKASKWFFIDNGIRNAVINDFAPLHMRNDIGCLWENFMISERIKHLNNQRLLPSFYFWRDYAGNEIDLIESASDIIRAFEFKWGDKPSKCPKSFSNKYPDIDYQLINRFNFAEFSGLNQEKP